MNRNLRRSLLALSVVALVAACGNDDSPAPTTAPATTAAPATTTPGGMGGMGGGTANPAAVYCGVQGGTYNGDDETCALADGRVVDSWEFFRGETDENTQIANPAAVYCAEQGGTHSLEDGSCTLPDGTVKDAWDYFRENH
jgi:putative hemolysin